MATFEISKLLIGEDMQAKCAFRGQTVMVYAVPRKSLISVVYGNLDDGELIVNPHFEIEIDDDIIEHNGPVT